MFFGVTLPSSSCGTVPQTLPSNCHIQSKEEQPVPVPEKFLFSSDLPTELE